MMLPYSMTYKVKFLFYFGCQLVGRDIGTFYFHARQYKRKLFIIDILNFFCFSSTHLLLSIYEPFTLYYSFFFLYKLYVFYLEVVIFPKEKNQQPVQ